MSFPNQNLDREKIGEYFSRATDRGLECSVQQKGKYAYHHSVRIDDKDVLLILHFKTDGRTTVQYSVGQHQDYSKSLAEEIIEYCKVADGNLSYCTYAGISLEEFNLLEIYVADEIPGASIKEKKDEARQCAIKILGRSDDTVTVHYYKTTGTTLVQGKPLPIFFDVRAFFSSFIPPEKIIESENELHRVDLKKEDVDNELAKYLPTAIKFLNQKVISIVTPSVVLAKIDVELDDYSCFSFPVLRGLEGYIRQLLQAYFPSYKNQQKIGSLFDPQKDGTFKVLGFVLKEIANETVCNALGDAYTQWYTKRHPYFHVDKTVGTTPIIESKEDALTLNIELFQTIEVTYASIIGNGKNV